MTGATALLVVDVQNRAIDLQPYCGEAVLRNITALIAACREAGVEVIHVQHDEAEGCEGEPFTEGWEIHPAVSPLGGERVFRKKHNSAFRGTGLGEYLEQRGVGTLVIVGIQTEYCIDTTVKVAFEYGFSVVIPEMTNTTYDNEDVAAEQIYQLHNERIFAGRFAELVPLDAALDAIRGPGNEGPRTHAPTANGHTNG